jgi:hypothetical protein
LAGFAEYDENHATSLDANAPTTPAEYERVLPLILAGKWPARMTVRHSLMSEYRIPFWFITALLALPGLTFLTDRLRRRRRRRRLGLCLECGYDLRGSPAVCPECGTSWAAASPLDLGGPSASAQE